MKTPHEVMPAWQQVTAAGRIALFPRWLGDTALLYSGDKGREMPAAYEVVLNGREKNLGRRNGTSPNVRLADGSILFSQPDYLDPYHVRQDLYVQRGDRQIRLTRGARLSSPDARADGEIVAVQDVPASTRLVRISSRGGTITPITSATIDTQWMDPRMVARWIANRRRGADPRHLADCGARCKRTTGNVVRRLPLDKLATELVA